MGLMDRLQHAWNAFFQNDKDNFVYKPYVDLGMSSTYRPDRMYYTKGNERSIVTSVYNRIAIDCSRVAIRHVRLDSNGRYLETIDSGLNNCLTIEANKDQSYVMFIRDVVQSLFDEGCIAIVPIDTVVDISKATSYDIETMRVGKITQWYPDNVKIYVFNDRKGFL